MLKRNVRKIKYPSATFIKQGMRKRRISDRKKRSKYNQHRFKFNGITYDSKLELDYGLYLESTHQKFIYHPDSIKIVQPYVNGTKKHIGNRYTPDFAIYENGKLEEYIDTKTPATRTTATQLRMSVFCSISDIPLYIAERSKNSLSGFEKKLF